MSLLADPTIGFLVGVLIAMLTLWASVETGLWHEGGCLGIIFTLVLIAVLIFAVLWAGDVFA